MLEEVKGLSGLTSLESDVSSRGTLGMSCPPGTTRRQSPASGTEMFQLSGNGGVAAEPRIWSTQLNDTAIGGVGIGDAGRQVWS